MTVLHLTGTLTFTAGGELGRRVRELLTRGTTQLALDLSEVSYIDSAGLGAIVEVFAVAKHKGVRLTLLSPTARTRHLLEITGLAKVVETFQAEAAMLESFQTIDEPALVD